MIRCQKCNAVMEDGSGFCGNCGAKISSTPSVIDGKKRKRSKRFIYHSGRTIGRTVFFLTGFAILLLLGIWFLADTLPQIEGLFGQIEKVVHQLILKSRYLAEGVPFHYISDNLSQLLNCLMILADMIFGGFLIVFGGYFTYYFGHNLYLHIKYREYYQFNRPISLEKISNVILVMGTVLLAIFLILFLGLSLAHFII